MGVQDFFDGLKKTYSLLNSSFTAALPRGFNKFETTLRRILPLKAINHTVMIFDFVKQKMEQVTSLHFCLHPYFIHH